MSGFRSGSSFTKLLVIFFYEKVFFFCDGACGDARNGESASSGCSDDGVDYSVTIVAKTTLSLSKNAGTGRLAYEIQGADKSSIVEATTNVDWIKNFNYAEPGYVQFDYTALDEGVESRSGQITLSYTGAADVVVTVNQGGTMTFELTIDPKSITANGCAMQIVPSNESETYLCAFMTKEYVDSFESDEAFIQADLEAVKEQAESRGMKLSEWLNILLMKGSKTNTVDDLSLANTAYYMCTVVRPRACLLRTFSRRSSRPRMSR